MADFYLVPQGTAWCIICEISFEVISKSSSRNIDFTLFTQPKLLFLMYFNTFKGNLCSVIIIFLFHYFVIHATCLEKGETQFTSPSSAGIGVFGPTPQKYLNARFCNLEQSAGLV